MNRGRPLLAIALLAACATSCDEEVTYTYFNVAVTLDSEMVMDEELMQAIVGCAALAQTPQRTDSATLGCVRGRLSANLGTFQYTTTLTSGSVTFKVILNGLNDVALAEGESSPVAIVPGKMVPASLVVKAIPGAPRRPPTSTATPDGGSTTD